MDPEGSKELDSTEQEVCFVKEEEEKQSHQEGEKRNELLFEMKADDAEMKLDDEEPASEGIIDCKIADNPSNDLINHCNDKTNDILTKHESSHNEQVQPYKSKEDLIESKPIEQIKQEPDIVVDDGAITHPEGQQSDNSNSSSSNSSDGSSSKEDDSNIHTNDTNNNTNNNHDEEIDDEVNHEEDQEGEEDKVDKRRDKSPNSQQGGENQEAFDGLSFLGRNRRVRQKSKLLMDFHCIELTKGSSGTRSTNRRSTAQPNRGQQGETDVFETKYCRKCFIRTPHDFEGGCQACLYKKIIESHKRQKPSNQKSRSGSSRQQQFEKSQIESPATATTTSTTTAATSATATTNAINSNKRKATKQGGPKHGSNSNNNTLNTNNINNVLTNDDNIANNPDNNGSTNIASITSPSSNTNDIVTNNVVTNNTTLPTANNLNTTATSKGDLTSNKLPRLDSWSPDEVADYISSRGFVSEAELFKTQSVDGISLLLMQRTDFTHGLKIKLGPALKIYDQVCKLKKEYFLNLTHT